MSLLINNTNRKPGTTKVTLYLPEEMILVINYNLWKYSHDINNFFEHHINTMLKANPEVIVSNRMNYYYEILPIEITLPEGLAFNLGLFAQRTDEDISNLIYNVLYSEYRYIGPPDPEPPDPPGYYEWFEEHWL